MKESGKSINFLESIRLCRLDSFSTRKLSFVLYYTNVFKTIILTSNFLILTTFVKVKLNFLEVYLIYYVE